MFFRSFAVILALLLMGMLIWVIATGSDDEGAGQRPTSSGERRAVRIEKRLREQLDDEELLLRTMNSWIAAGSARIAKLDSFEKPLDVPAAAREDYEAGLRAWGRYLKKTNGAAGRDVAELAGVILFRLVEIGSRDPAEAATNAADAVRAQEIVCKQDPSLYTLSDLAVYRYFNGEYAAGDRAAREAAASAAREEASIKPRGVIDQLNEYRERGEKFVARVRRGFETLEETGEEELDYTIKGYGAPAGLNGHEPGTS